jgi:radical SAM protein with 4Fe4S-binding SPASM domain
MNGLTVVNIELTNRCNKDCWMCGRRVVERDYPEVSFEQDMDFDLLKIIARQIPKGIVVQFHNNGEPTLYPRLREALDLFPNNIKCFNTNGKLLLQKADEIINNLDTLTISVIENDLEGDKQYEIVKKFIEIKDGKRRGECTKCEYWESGFRKPYMIYRLLGDVGFSNEKNYIEKNGELYEERVIKKQRWYDLSGLVCTRILHSPLGSYNYQKKVTKPEIGICLDLLNHMTIDVNGNVSICVRFDPHKYGVIGNAYDTPLKDLWESEFRQNLIKEHIKGNRKANQLCETCDFYGCPTER